MNIPKNYGDERERRTGGNRWIHYSKYRKGGNIFSDKKGWTTVSLEELIERNPDVIIVTVGKIARFISSVDDNIPLRIDAYWPAVSKDWVAPSKDEMRSALNAARKYLKNVSSLTGDRSVKGEVIRIV